MLQDAHTRNIAQSTAARRSFWYAAVGSKLKPRCVPVKSHTPECAKIEQFAATLVPVKSNVVCFQDFDTKDYKLEIQGRFITITKQQFDDGMWQEIVRGAVQ